MSQLTVQIHLFTITAARDTDQFIHNIVPDGLVHERQGQEGG